MCGIKKRSTACNRCFSELHVKENLRRKAAAHPRLQAIIWGNDALALMCSMTIRLAQSDTVLCSRILITLFGAPILIPYTIPEERELVWW